MSDNTSVSETCKACNRITGLMPCQSCGGLVCPSHRMGLGSATEYFCTTQCVVKSAFPTPPDHRALMISSLKKFVWAALVALGIFLLYYYHG